MKSVSWHAVSMAAVLAALVWRPAPAGELPPDLGSRLVRGYIAPAMAHFAQTASDMQGALARFCAGSAAAPAQDAASAASLDEHFASLVRAWSGIEFLRFGPLVEDNRFERIYFWPDPRGIMLRQIQALLAQADHAGQGSRQASGAAARPALDANTLAGHSVAVQGIPALEYMLYRENGLLRRSARQGPRFAADCAYATAIAANVSSIGKDIARAWAAPVAADARAAAHQASAQDAGAYAQYFSRPSPSNPVYRTTQELAAEAIKAVSTGLQFARDIKILPMLGKQSGVVIEKKAPFWRSGLFAQAMMASAMGLGRFVEAGQWPYGQHEAWIGLSIQDELGRVRDGFDVMPRELAALVRQPDGRRQLTLAALLLKNTKDIVDQNMAPAFGARIGFNALDGD